MKRRTFVAGVATAAAGAVGVWRWLVRRPAELGPAASSPEGTAPSQRPAVQAGPEQALPAGHVAILAAMVARLLPDQDDFPGARQLGVMAYIERELGRSELEEARQLVMRGASQLVVVANQELGRGFLQLEGPEQDRVIAAMLDGAGSRGPFEAPRFVETMLSLTLEGAFGDPIHGGNRDGAGWAAIGYAMHPPRPGHEGHH